MKLQLATILLVTQAAIPGAALAHVPVGTQHQFARPAGFPGQTALPGDIVSDKDEGMSLAQAIESVRRRTDGQIVKAETVVNGNREVHHIRVLGRDGKVKTYKVPGKVRHNH